MRFAGKVVGETLKLLQGKVRVGITTAELNKIAEAYIVSKGCKPCFKGYDGYPAAICTSINSQVVHGIPSKVALKDGDIISIDIGASYKGYNGDAARTFPVGKVSDEVLKLIQVTEQSFFEGIKFLKAGAKIGDVANAIQVYAEQHGFSVVRELTGHGIGTSVHEDPAIPNYGKSGTGATLQENQAIAIEPMINLGQRYVFMWDDNWTIESQDHKPSAHYENTVIVTKNGCDILTL
ncbi:MAG: type I methionyl aminopeptidase [Clostridia bacterium]|jgi:methionyl aminopeptidase|nr:type I methionyl aminopeptidase [Clostridia bacterium]